MVTIVQVHRAFLAVLVATRPPEASANALYATLVLSHPSLLLPRRPLVLLVILGTSPQPLDSTSANRVPLGTTPRFWAVWTASRVGLGRIHSAVQLRALDAALDQCPRLSPPSHRQCALPVQWDPGRLATPRDAKSAARARTGTTHGSSPSLSTPWCLYSTALIRVFGSRCTL